MLQKNAKIAVKHTKYEKCCLGGQLTDTPAEMPVQKRHGYIEGAGQLCRKCYCKLYEKQIRISD